MGIWRGCTKIRWKNWLLRLQKKLLVVIYQIKQLLSRQKNTLHGEKLDCFDEDEILDRLEMHLMEISRQQDNAKLEERIEERRAIVEKKN